jgi:hypothetical protein
VQAAKDGRVFGMAHANLLHHLTAPGKR